MKVVEFKHQSAVIAKDQQPYLPLPVLQLEGKESVVVSCWNLSFKERVKVMVTGKVWLSSMSFNNPLTPSLLTVNRKEIYTHPDDEVSWIKRLLKKKK